MISRKQRAKFKHYQDKIITNSIYGTFGVGTGNIKFTMKPAYLTKMYIKKMPQISDIMVMFNAIFFKNFKIGDIVYIQNNSLYYKDDNNEMNLLVLLTDTQIEEFLYTEKEYRKVKLQKLMHE